MLNLRVVYLHKFETFFSYFLGKRNQSSLSSNYSHRVTAELRRPFFNDTEILLI